MEYLPMSLAEIENFKEMFSVFQDLILAMIRNAVRVLPKNKIDSQPSLTAHLHVNAATKHAQEYENFIDIKDVFLSCISDENRREFFKKSILYFTLNNKRKIKFCIKKSFYSRINEQCKINFSNDVKKLEKIINDINDNFNIRLPEAKQQGRLMISKIRRIDIPQKAKYTGKNKGKNRGIA